MAFPILKILGFNITHKLFTRLDIRYDFMKIGCNQTKCVCMYVG